MLAVAMKVCPESARGLQVWQQYDLMLRRSVCAAGQPAYSQVSRCIEPSGSDRGFPALTGRSGTQRARPLSLELAAPLGVWMSSQLARFVDGRGGWRLSGGRCCTWLLYFACLIGTRAGRRAYLPIVRFSGRTYPQLARIVRVLCAVAGRCCLPLVAAVAVTVGVRSYVRGVREMLWVVSESARKRLHEQHQRRHIRAYEHVASGTIAACSSSTTSASSGIPSSSPAILREPERLRADRQEVAVPGSLGPANVEDDSACREGRGPECGWSIRCGIAGLGRFPDWEPCGVGSWECRRRPGARGRLGSRSAGARQVLALAPVWRG